MAALIELVEKLLNTTMRMILHTNGDKLRFLRNLTRLPFMVARIKQLGRSPYFDADSDDEDRIVFTDEPVLYELIVQWNPETSPPPMLYTRLQWLNYDHKTGSDQTPLKRFYRIFLTRQLNAEFAARPRFLTPARRARINSQRIAARAGTSV